MNEIIEKIKGKITTIKSMETEKTYKSTFDPAPISIEGKSITFPHWMEPQSYSVNILNKDSLICSTV